MKKNKFLRTGTRRYKRLGKGSKKKQRWRRAKGRHSKIRENKKSKQRKVQIGFKKSRKERGKIQLIVRNIRDAEKIKQGDCVVIGKIGKKKRIEIEKKIGERKGIIINIKK